MTRCSGFIRASEIARELGMSERTVRRWIAEKTLPSVKVGGTRLVARADLQRLLATASDVVETFPNQLPAATHNQ